MTQLVHRMPAVIILVVLLVALASCASDASPSPSHTSAAASPTAVAPTPLASAPEPEPTSTPVPLALTWSADPEPFPGSVAALAADMGALVAVGRDRDGLAAWTSADGAHWDRHDVPDPTFIADMVDDFGPALYGGTGMGPLTRLGDTLFSFGTFFGPNDFYRPVGWRSPDGANWEFVESNSDFYGYGTATDAETFGEGLLAARAIGLIGPYYGLWRWTSDASWQETSIQSDVGAVIVRLDAAPVGDRVIAVGQLAERETLDDLGTNQPMAWASSDGAQWDEFELPSGMASVCGLDETPSGGFTVMGTRGNGDVAVWTSPDGLSWTRSDLAPGVCGDSPVTLAGDWVVASVSTGAQGSKVWLSHDGLEWVQQEIPEVQSVAVAELNGELHILGTPRLDRPYQSVLLHGMP